MAQIFLVRHGRPARHADGFDPGLSEQGILHSKTVAAFLETRKISAIYASPLKRARQTAEPLMSATGVELVFLDGLAEADRDNNYVFAEDTMTDPAEWAKFQNDPIAYLGGDHAAFVRTVRDAFQVIRDANHTNNVVVFTHAFPINIVLADALGLDGVLNFIPHYCSISRVKALNLCATKVISVNETAHLV
jgi:broad specificity phosphatase PhoE